MQFGCIDIAQEEINSIDCNDIQKVARQSNFMVHKRIYRGLIIHARTFFGLMYLDKYYLCIKRIFNNSISSTFSCFGRI